MPPDMYDLVMFEPIFSLHFEIQERIREIVIIIIILILSSGKI